MNIWFAVLLLYAGVWTLYGIAWRVKRRRNRRVPGPWRVTGRNDLMSPPRITWFADNNVHYQVKGPYDTEEAAQRECNRLNRALQKSAPPRITVDDGPRR